MTHHRWNDRTFLFSYRNLFLPVSSRFFADKCSSADYAEVGIPEYRIVDPEDETISVLTLAGDAYSKYGVFRRGAQTTSALLAGFAVEVSAVFDAE